MGDDAAKLQQEMRKLFAERVIDGMPITMVLEAAVDVMFEVAAKCVAELNKGDE